MKAWLKGAGISTLPGITANPEVEPWRPRLVTLPSSCGGGQGPALPPGGTMRSKARFSAAGAQLFPLLKAGKAAGRRTGTGSSLPG